MAKTHPARRIVAALVKLKPIPPVDEAVVQACLTRLPEEGFDIDSAAHELDEAARQARTAGDALLALTANPPTTGVLL